MRLIRGTKTWLLSALMAIPLFALQANAHAQAQPYPTRPVHIIVGVSPGGGVDFVARVLAQQLSKIWGQAVIVENRLGAGGAAANDFVAKSPADGYTLLVTSDDITASSAYRAHLPYDLLHDLRPVSLLETGANVLVVNPALPVHSIKDLIALAKSEPGKLTYGSAGVGSIIHLQTARFTSMAGVNMVHVPYKGSAAAAVGVAEGEIDMTFASAASAQALAKSGKVRLVAVSSPQRWPLTPSIPTAIESGLPGYSYIAWYGMFAPAGLPENVLATVSAGVAQALSLPDVRAALAKQGTLAQTDSSKQFSAMVRTDLAQKINIMKMSGIKPQ